MNEDQFQPNERCPLCGKRITEFDPVTPVFGDDMRMTLTHLDCNWAEEDVNVH